LLLVKDVDRAIEMAREGMTKTEGLPYEAYKKAYTKSLFAKLKQLNEAEKFADALKLYDEEKRWFEMYGPESLLAAAETYQGLGFYSTSNDLMAKFADRARSGRGLASVVQTPGFQLDRARNSFAKGDYAGALRFLPPNGGTQGLYLAAVSRHRLGQRKDSWPLAEKALTAAKTEANELTRAQVEQLAEILIDRDEKDRDFSRMERDVALARAVCPEPSERLEYAAADSLWYQKRHGEAVAAYRLAMEKFPQGERANRGKYNLGMSLVALGKREEAVKALTELKDSGQGVWSESAKQELELLSWEKKYSSVLRTLPPTGLGIGN
jgi:tetratricopeptide (TPR) repeat protein